MTDQRQEWFGKCPHGRTPLAALLASVRKIDHRAQMRTGARQIPGPCLDYKFIASTSATKRFALSLRNEATTVKTASLKPPTFRMSERSGASVVFARYLAAFDGAVAFRTKGAASQSPGSRSAPWAERRPYRAYANGVASS